MKPANKSRGEVAFPPAGEGAFLCFTMDSLERLEGEFGENYLDVVTAGLTKARPKIYRNCFLVSLNGGDPKGFPWDQPLELLQGFVLDALYVTVHGRTFEEQQKHEDEIFKQRLEESKTNPRMAAALFSKLADEQGTAPGSNQPSSAA